MALLAVAVMVFAYVLTSRLNAASRFVGIDRDSNAMVLARAKRALIGYMAQQAALAGENNPGHLPCPEAPANFGTTNEGIEASFCAVPTVGRLPWRTLGLEKLVDAAGEPLWYAVSTGWHRPSSTATLTINSDTPGQLSLNGPTNDVVAVIIAPGPAITVLGGGPCTGWAQSHPTAGPPDVRNYLECGNESGNFVTGAPGATFNDQVLRVAVADLMPALEAAVAHRMQREIAPALRSVYGSVTWGTTGNPIFPFAARFDNPNPGSATYRGEDGRYQGRRHVRHLEHRREPCSVGLRRRDHLVELWLSRPFHRALHGRLCGHGHRDIEHDGHGKQSRHGAALARAEQHDSRVRPDRLRRAGARQLRLGQLQPQRLRQRYSERGRAWFARRAGKSTQRAIPADGGPRCARRPLIARPDEHGPGCDGLVRAQRVVPGRLLRRRTAEHGGWVEQWIGMHTCRVQLPSIQ
jgi:hypothetical protein